MSDTFQEQNLLTEVEQQECMEAVGHCVMQAIKTGDSAFVSFPPFDLVLMVVQQEDFSVQSAMFPLSRCTKGDDGEVRLPMPPIYAGRRHIMNPDDCEGYYSEEEVKQLHPKTQQAMMFIMNLLRTIRLGSGIY